MGGLGNGALRLERCRGVSLMWLAYNWGDLLERLPAPVTRTVLMTLDRIAAPLPQIADVIVGVWERPAAGPAAPPSNGRATLTPAATGEQAKADARR